MKQDEVESQLSAMFDGELPPAECELLSRRIDRDENLRARWSRYALMGAAMRFEPVATAHRNFAARVSSALEQAEAKTGSALPALAATQAGRAGARTRRLWWQAALAAGLVGAVAGLSITMLRDVTLGTSAGGLESARNLPDAHTTGTVLSLPTVTARGAVAAARLARAQSAGPAAAAAAAAGPGGAAAGAIGAIAGHEPWSYVTPRDDGGANTPLRTDLVDYIVAHSEYSTPLMRPDLLSELISGEDIDATPSPASASGR